MTTPVPVQKNAETVGSIGGDEFAELQQNEEMVPAECQLAWDVFECFTACQRAAKRVLLEVHPDKFAHSFGCLRADHSRFGIAHALTLSFRGEANTACHARF